MIGVRVCIVQDDEQWAAVRSIRRQVFIDEQQIPQEEEFDVHDLPTTECAHFIAYASPTEKQAGVEVPVGTARLLSLNQHEAKAQRVAVLASQRKHGVGAAVMQALEAEALRRGHRVVILGAQLTAIPFYKCLGYETYGEIFIESGIQHSMMQRSLENR